MRRCAVLVVIFPAILMISRPAPARQLPLTRYVDPFIGTSPAGASFGFGGNTGDVFPGADYPMGMLQWSPDTYSNLPGGYSYPDRTIKGFSIRHFSGRGCIAMQDFTFMPFVGKVAVPPMKDNGFYSVPFSHKDEIAVPGYYSVRLGDGVKVELTVTKRTGIGKFIFPRTGDATLIINGSSSARGTTANTLIDVVGHNEIHGRATARVGCGKELYTIYFVARFDRPFISFGTWNNARISDGARSSSGDEVGTILTFDASQNQTVRVKVAVSFVSIENAMANLNAENPNWDFNTVRKEADAVWNKILNKIVVTGGTLAQKRSFYTALYHCFFVPNVFNDVNGQYVGMDNKIHHVAKGRTQYENISSWDAYRSTTALMALIASDVESDIAQSLINDAEQGGGALPRWEQANHNSGGMVGDGPVIILAEDYAFGARNFDTSAAFTAMKTDANKVGATSDGNLARKGLGEYIKLGYVPGSASITLEYASSDFALAQFAKALGYASDYQNYLKRSLDWKKLYNGSTGYIQPRDSSGAWIMNVTPYTETGYTEGSAAQYTWMVPFDLKGLIELMGGKAQAVSRLDKYFTFLNVGPKSPYAFMGNEPCEGDPWIYDYAGAPYKTQGVVRRIQNDLFTDLPDGLPGNDDGGALSSWYIFSALGMYPLVPGLGIYVLGSPLFPKTVVHLNEGDLTITGKGAALDAPYVQSLTVNGKKWNKPWISFEDISGGGKLIYQLGRVPNTSWGSKPEDAPPSY